MKHILLLDNYDSFTFNLEHYFCALGASVVVKRSNDDLGNIDEYDGFVFSPGPGLPSESVGMQTILKNRNSKVPVLGVCLGMQCIAEFLGGELYNQRIVKHGVQERIYTKKSVLFDSIENSFEVGLYHSWAVREGSGCFQCTAFTQNNVVMAIENQSLNLYGVQFHPESILTENGKRILENFLCIY